MLRSLGILFALALANLAWVWIVLLGFERLWPKTVVSLRSQLRSATFWLFYTVAAVTITALAASSLVGREPLYDIDVASAGWGAYILAPIAFLLIYDFFNYWMHRAQHKWFWKQHSIHHSIENLSAINSYFHPTEPLFRLACITFPMTYLFGVAGAGASIAAAMLDAAYGNFIHSPITIHFGRFGRLFLVDNRYHRIHHSVEPRHFDKNFATATPVWDVLFGTAHFPARDEWPDTGVHDQAEPQTISDYLLRPFKLSGRAEPGPCKSHPSDKALHPRRSSYGTRPSDL